MSDVDIVKRMTAELCENTHDKEVLDKYFAPSFTFWSNGQQGDLAEYASDMAKYGQDYENFSIPNWDVIFETDEGVVVSYILVANKKDGGTERIAVMAIWGLIDGKVVSLRQVLANL